jgi:hypothetical protein
LAAGDRLAVTIENRVFRPYAQRHSDVENDGMSMYADLLSSALTGELEELSEDALVDYTLTCRANLLASGSSQRISAYSALATEIAYDRALMKLCAVHHIEAAVANFSHPINERHRLEVQLQKSGIDLATLGRRRVAG